MNPQLQSTSSEQSTASDIRYNNPEILEVFSETARTDIHDSDRQRLSAHTLFSSFTAGIINENTLFTR